MPAIALRNKGVNVYAVGVTENVDNSELQAISGTRRNVFRADNFTSLGQTLRSQLTHAVCKDAVEAAKPAGLITSVCGKPIDLILVIDDSQSIGKTNYKKVNRDTGPFPKISLHHYFCSR